MLLWNFRSPPKRKVIRYKGLGIRIAELLRAISGSRKQQNAFQILSEMILNLEFHILE